MKCRETAQARFSTFFENAFVTLVNLRMDIRILRSWRSTAIILVAIPMAILGALAGLYFTGDTINAMTLGGLSLAVGILVDQSIVVTENISRHLRMGKTGLKAALDGAGLKCRHLVIL